MVRTRRTAGRRRGAAASGRATGRITASGRTVRRGRSSSSSNSGPETGNQQRGNARGNGALCGTSVASSGRGRGQGARQQHAQAFQPTAASALFDWVPYQQQPPRFMAAYHHQPPSSQQLPGQGNASRPTLAYGSHFVDRTRIPSAYRTAEFVICPQEFVQSMETFQREARANIDSLSARVRQLEGMFLTGAYTGMDNNMPTDRHYD